MRTALKARMPTDSTSDAAKAIAEYRAKVDSVGGNAGGGGGGGFGGRRPPPNLFDLNGRLAGMLTGQDNADQAPTQATLDGYGATCRDLRTAIARWTAINENDLATLNAVLSKSGLQQVMAAAGIKAPACGEKAAR
jgi:hypothetical protein